LEFCASQASREQLAGLLDGLGRRVGVIQSQEFDSPSG
jgi:hypothetical protein